MMSGTQQNDAKRQHLLERLLDAVKQCQIRFGGKKEIASDSDSRVICLCAQFEAVLLHGLRRSRGLALTAAAIKQVTGFSNKTETELSFWFYVKEHLNRHELQRFYSLHNITSEVGRGRAWLRCALNEHSLERSLLMLLSDRTRLGAFYEDWAFIMDEERASMLPTMAAGLNSILFAIQIDNTDLNGQNRAVPSVSHLLKESTQGVSSLWKESTQGVSTLLREITTTATSNTRPEQEAEPLPVLPRSASAESRLKKERKKKKKVTNIISFDNDDEGGDEEEEYGVRKSGKGRASSEEMERHDHSPMLNGVGGWGGGHTPYGCRMDTKSIDNEEEDEELYGKAASRGELEEEPLVGSLSSLSTCSPLQVLNDNDSSDILLPVSTGDAYSQSEAAVEDQGYREEQDNATLAVELAERVSQLQFSMEDSPPVKNNTMISMLPPTVLPESMTVTELRQAIVAMMNRKDELEDQNSSLRSLLDGEMEYSAALRQELDSLKKRLAELEERHAGKVQALGRENEVLKVQLKKYVGAVQMLKREGGQTNDVLLTLRNCDGEPPVPEPKPAGDSEELAASYERKLIEVAEMHGELIEFNERLYRSLMAKDHLVAQMRQELIDLRGPVPGDLSQTSDDPSLSDFETAHRALINVWIPSVFMRGRAANAYHVYQVYIRILDNEWNVYRRYTDFRTLHHRLRSRFPQVDTFNFPPKKAIGNKDAKFVESRRKQLQSYLRSVMNKVIQTLPKFTASPTKENLLQLLPFCIKEPPYPGMPFSRTEETLRFKPWTPPILDCQCYGPPHYHVLPRSFPLSSGLNALLGQRQTNVTLWMQSSLLRALWK
ncbi:sorting nexin-29 isoform X2 [Acipenser ruthenus]|uniref:sorting nexin-29 isoform X2 n=1 Tax=Acipenser ruthenus TaxID=7906 RepID=UPI0027418C7F|nr:sorting nexin-29 isoform X2 [Acipenser ruthenus]